MFLAVKERKKKGCHPQMHLCLQVCKNTLGRDSNAQAYLRTFLTELVKTVFFFMTSNLMSLTCFKKCQWCYDSDFFLCEHRLMYIIVTICGILYKVVKDFCDMFFKHIFPTFLFCWGSAFSRNMTGCVYSNV